MFKRILIANRGEVAVRVARACREEGIAPVGIASEADMGSAWLGLMDEVVCIGPAPARDSYLCRTAVLQAALQTRCSALHPGWGFLAEDPLFAAMCNEHRVTFIGPPAEVIERMGIKSRAKRAARASGLDVIPGSAGVLSGVAEAAEVARSVGYPVILKADAGGGGRGIRRCSDERELREAFPAALAEAQAAFGNADLYLERFVSGGRHVEVQVLVDSFGSAVHLGERECSVQRNHQKLLEESPSPALSDPDREALGRSAAEASAAFGYRGAGTIEFLLDESGRLFFMEMNTRLQVEHPVSEMLSGVDIVRAQIAIAAHRSLDQLGLAPGNVRLRGHAVECRINAEDPEQGFRPAPGRVAVFEIPEILGPGTVRVDTHIAAGERVSPHYDSLIAKVIVHGSDRDAAIETMTRALKGSRIEGVRTTIPLHLAVLASAEFRSGRYDTRSVPGWHTAPSPVGTRS